MSGSHGPAQALFLPVSSPVHRLRPQCKLAATSLFILAVVASPRETFWAYAAYAVGLAAVARAARVPLGYLLRRLTIELPFVAFAVFLPFIAGGDRIEVLGLSLASEGLWAAWNILIKGTLGVAATVILASTTPVAELLHGLDRLKLPKAFTAVAGFMIRYLDVVTEEMRRMKIARLSRGYDPRWFWQAKALATSSGALFLRSYERGERVFLSMVSRGFSGAMPLLDAQAAPRSDWLAAMAVSAVAIAISSAAWLIGS